MDPLCCSQIYLVCFAFIRNKYPESVSNGIFEAMRYNLYPIFFSTIMQKATHNNKKDNGPIKNFLCIYLKNPNICLST